MLEEFSAELRIESVEVNPFVLSLRINNLALDNPQGEPTVRIGEFFTNFQLSSIFKLAITLDEFRLSATELYVARDEFGEMNFAYLLAEGTATTQPDPHAGDNERGILPLLVYQFIIDDFIVHWLDEAPSDPIRTKLGPIAIDIKGLNTLPDQSGEQIVVIDTQNLGTLSWQGDLQLNPLRSSARASLEGAQFEILSAYLREAAGVDIVGGNAGFELDYEVAINEDGQFSARIDNLDLNLRELLVNTYADGSGFDFAGENAQLLNIAAIDLSGGKIQWPAQTVSVESILIEDPVIDVSRDEAGIFNLQPVAGANEQEVITDNTQDITQAGSIDTNWQVSIDQFAVENLVTNFIDNSLSSAAKLGITRTNLRINDITNTAGASFQLMLDLESQTGGSVSLAGDFSVLPRPLVNFDLAVSSLALDGINPYIAEFANLNLQTGDINLQARIIHNADEVFAYSGNFGLDELLLVESIDNQRLASWQSFIADNIELSLSQSRLDISQLQFNQPYGDILIDQNGRLNFGQVVKQPDEAINDNLADSNPEVASTDSSTANETLSVQIGGITVDDASADFTDLNLPLPFAVTIEGLNGKVTTISNRSIEPAEVSFEGKVDEYGFARVDGFITPLEPQRNTDIRLTFENIDVPKFTPYSIPFAGREIASGTLDLALGYQIKDSQLIGDNNMVLRDFELGDETPHPDALDIPLGLAVALLKDPSGKIDIDLPVTGNVDDPEFSYAGVVWRALGNLLVKIVVSPFNLLGNLLGVEASELESVSFIAGRSDLTPPELQRTQKLAEALSLRPELLLVIGGVYEEQADGLALRSALVNQQVESEITRLTETGDPSIQYAEHRRKTLETLLTIQLGETQATTQLAELVSRFTSETVIEGQTEPTVEFDNLAYVNAIYQQLIELQKLDTDDLQQLADARAQSLQSALVSIDASLQARIKVDGQQSISVADDDVIRMPVSLEARP